MAPGMRPRTGPGLWKRSVVVVVAALALAAGACSASPSASSGPTGTGANGTGSTPAGSTPGTSMTPPAGITLGTSIPAAAAAAQAVAAVTQGAVGLTFATGTVEGTDLIVATARTAEGGMVAYFCNGRDVGVWFSGAVHASTDGVETVAMQGFSGEVPAGGTGASLSGSATVGGATVRFTTHPARIGGLVRQLDESTDPSILSGWILTDEGLLVGVSTQSIKATPGSIPQPTVVRSLRVDVPVSTIEQQRREAAARANVSTEQATTQMMLGIVAGAMQTASAAGGFDPTTTTPTRSSTTTTKSAAVTTMLPVSPSVSGAPSDG